MGSQVGYLCSNEVQGDIHAIFTEAAATSLDVERKHFQDKKAEGYKLMSLATASRNAILRRYRQARTTEIGRVIRHRKEVLKHKFMSASALAVMRNPSWFKRGRGERKWESGVSSEQRSSIVFEGDKEKLDHYMQVNREELDTTARKMRDHAKAVEKSFEAEAEVPLRNLKWRRWLDDHEKDWGEAMAKAAEERVRELSHC